MKFETTMKSITASASTVIAALLLITSASAAADDAGWYLGGNLGQSSATIDEDKIRANLAASGLTMTSIDSDERDFGYKVFGGYQFNRYFAIEGGYFDLGEFGFTATTSPPGTLSGEMELTGMFVDPVLILPMTERFSALARIGFSSVEAESSFSATGSASAPPNREKRSSNYKYGVGLQYAVTERLGLRAEVERYRIDDAVGADNEGDLDLVSLGLVYRFAGEKVAAAPMATPPPVVAAAPAPVAAPEPVRTEEYCSFLDIAFEINKGAIQREEKERLAYLGTFLTKYPKTTAIIQGHADNVGSDEDNLRLSQQRADGVVQYLVNDLHVAPSRLRAVGYGESRPIADNNTSEGKKANRRINAVIRCATDIEGLRVIPARVTLAIEMEFDPKSSEIEPQYRDNLAHVANYLKANPTVTATVEGHAATSIGVGAREVAVSDELAMQLSKRRAQNVVKYLISKYGIESSRLSAEGFGNTRRVTYDDTLAEQKENRRVNIILNYARK